MLTTTQTAWRICPTFLYIHIYIFKYIYTILLILRFSCYQVPEVVLFKFFVVFFASQSSLVKCANTKKKLYNVTKPCFLFIIEQCSSAVSVLCSLWTLVVNLSWIKFTGIILVGVHYLTQILCMCKSFTYHNFGISIIFRWRICLFVCFSLNLNLVDVL